MYSCLWKQSMTASTAHCPAVAAVNNIIKSRLPNTETRLLYKGSRLNSLNWCTSHNRHVNTSEFRLVSGSIIIACTVDQSYYYYIIIKNDRTALRLAVVALKVNVLKTDKTFIIYDIFFLKYFDRIKYILTLCTRAPFFV